nr:nucleotidyltransferase domain-containing protein [Candidatus Freyarchaeota archaeon]
MTSSNRLSEVFGRYSNVVAAYVFGSRARGDFREDSDWDIGVLLRQGFSARDFLEFLEDLREALGVDFKKLNLVVLNDADIDLAFQALHEGKLLYEKDRDLRSDLEVAIVKRYLDAKPLLELRKKRLEEIYRLGQSERVPRHA